jgi:2',3'-cyclic-nucleotide 2'-phosphodiesterase / 3'-nucleotidase
VVPAFGVSGVWLLRVLHSFPFLPSRHPGQVHLRILGTTDLHVHLLPFDYTADRVRETVGLSRIAGVIAAMRRGAANTLLFDNGDFLQGSALGDLIARDGLAEGDVHPMIAAMNALRYDAGTLGNHEFSHGLPFLMRALRDAAFPVVSANTETAAA